MILACREIDVVMAGAASFDGRKEQPGVDLFGILVARLTIAYVSRENDIGKIGYGASEAYDLVWRTGLHAGQ